MQKNKRALFLALTIYPSTTGGMEIFTNHIIKALNKSGDSEVIPILYKGTTYEGSNVEYVLKSFFRVQKFGLHHFSLRVQLFFILKKYRDFSKTIFINYTSNAQYLAKFIPKLCEKFNFNYVLIIHGGGMGKWHNHDEMKLFFQKAHGLIAVSPKIKEHYEKLAGKLIEYIPPTIPFNGDSAKEPIRKSKLQSTFEILYVGSLKDLKDPMTLLNAFLSLGKKYIKDNNLELHFVGDGPLKETLLDKVKEEKMESAVIFHGKVVNEKVQKYYEKATVYVTSSEFEGTSISLIQALFNKLAIIATNVNGNKDVITHNDNGLLFEFKDSETLKNHIILLAENKNIRELISKNAYNTYFEKFAFEYVAEKYKSFIVS